MPRKSTYPERVVLQAGSVAAVVLTVQCAYAAQLDYTMCGEDHWQSRALSSRFLLDLRFCITSPHDVLSVCAPSDRAVSPVGPVSPGAESSCAVRMCFQDWLGVAWAD